MTAELPDEAYVVALLSLPELWPARLAALLGVVRPTAGPCAPGPVGPDHPGDGSATERSARDVWELVVRGRARLEVGRRRLHPPDPVVLARRWTAASAGVDVAGLWAGCVRAGVRVDVLGRPGYPPELVADGQAPWVLFRRGAVMDLAGARVAVIGTRRASPVGREVARELGAGLSRVGVRVVSGLALGIDAAAHDGALAAGGGAPVGIVAGGFDHPYPLRHRPLWAQVAGRGVLVSEWPPSARSEGWRFPARNRIIAALADVVVVVESGAAGGSMLTAEAALARGRPVMAVPGSVRNPAATGTNRLLADGAAPACGLDDVLAALALATVGSCGPPVPSRSPGTSGPAGSSGPPGYAGPSQGSVSGGSSDQGGTLGSTGGSAGRPAATGRSTGPAARVLEALDWDAEPLETVVRRCGLPAPVVAAELVRLELAGAASSSGGWRRADSDRRFDRRGPER